MSFCSEASKKMSLASDSISHESGTTFSKSSSSSLPSLAQSRRAFSDSAAVAMSCAQLVLGALKNWSGEALPKPAAADMVAVVVLPSRFMVVLVTAGAP